MFDPRSSLLTYDQDRESWSLQIDIGREKKIDIGQVEDWRYCCSACGEFLNMETTTQSEENCLESIIVKENYL